MEPPGTIWNARRAIGTASGPGTPSGLIAATRVRVCDGNAMNVRWTCDASFLGLPKISDFWGEQRLWSPADLSFPKKSRQTDSKALTYTSKRYKRYKRYTFLSKGVYYLQEKTPLFRIFKLIFSVYLFQEKTKAAPTMIGELLICTASRGRTGTPITGQGILSPSCLPIPPWRPIAFGRKRLQRYKQFLE